MRIADAVFSYVTQLQHVAFSLVPNVVALREETCA